MLKLKMGTRRLLCAVVVLMLIGIIGGTTKGAIITVGLELRDMADNAMPPGSILAPGTDYKIFATVACADPQGISGGSVDVTLVNPPADFTFNSFTMYPGAPGPSGPNGTVQPTPPEADDIGLMTFIFTPGFAHPGPVEFFTIEATANSLMRVGTPNDPPGIISSPGAASFAVTGAGNPSPDDVEWGSIPITPEPASLSLLVVGGLVALRRRRKNRTKA